MIFCNQMAASCCCREPKGHAGVHRCHARCGGEWLGTYGGGDFKVVMLPIGTPGDPEYRDASQLSEGEH